MVQPYALPQPSSGLNAIHGSFSFHRHAPFAAGLCLPERPRVHSIIAYHRVLSIELSYTCESEGQFLFKFVTRSFPPGIPSAPPLAGTPWNRAISWAGGMVRRAAPCANRPSRVNFAGCMVPSGKGVAHRCALFALRCGSTGWRTLLGLGACDPEACSGEVRALPRSSTVLQTELPITTRASAHEAAGNCGKAANERRIRAPLRCPA